MTGVSPRPDTGSGRFGNLSYNSFFTRHNPHPGRVRHIKGLNDVPICAVNDDGFFPDARYKLDLPGTNFKPAWDRIPVNAINVNSKLHPINTVTGLTYFTGLNSYPYREKAVPKFGMVPVTERWRHELQALTAAAGLASQPKAPEEPKRPMYSAETGRLLPPPSRALTRGASRRGKGFRAYEHITQAQEMENNVLQMLCQILQTEDVNAVQAWLISAADQEKAYVLDLIKSAVASREDYYRREPVLITTPLQETTQPAAQSSEQIVQQVDRLSLEGVPPREKGSSDADVARYTRYSYNDAPAALAPAKDAAAACPPTSEAFRPKQKPCTPAQPTPSKEAAKPPPSPTLRYTKSPAKPATPYMAPRPDWSQNDSTIKGQ